MSESFGFMVGRAHTLAQRLDGERWLTWQELQNLPPEGWTVVLPHQCDQWQIAGVDLGHETLAAAVAAMERFVAEAQSALAALRRGEPYGLEKAA